MPASVTVTVICRVIVVGVPSAGGASPAVYAQVFSSVVHH